MLDNTNTEVGMGIHQRPMGRTKPTGDGDMLENRRKSWRREYQDKIREKLITMQVGISGHHLVHEYILSKHMRRAWMKSVIAEEKKENIRQERSIP